MEVHGEEIFPIQPFRSLAVIFLLKKILLLPGTGPHRQAEEWEVGQVQPPIKFYYNEPVGGINWGMKPTGGDIFGPRQRYLRTRTEISLDKSGDIRPQSRTRD